MSASRQNSLDRVLGRVDSLDSVNLSNLVKRLARERELLETVFNTLQEGVLVIDAAGLIEYANESARRLVGHGDGEIAGQTLWRLVPGLRPPSTGTPASMEFDLTYPEPRTLRLYMVPFKGGGRGGAQKLAVILADISQDRKATGKRIEDERTSSILLLAAGVAHELGNPLNSLGIHLQLMARKLAGLPASARTESLAGSVKVCRDEVARLDGIVRNFLEAVQPRTPNLVDTDLSDVLAEVLKFQRREFADRGVAVEAQIPDSLPMVMADRDQLKQAFFNITRNAVEAMKPGGKLRIKSRADDDCVYLLFGDSGSGIASADLANLFQPYRSSKPGGHGLGLMIVQRIMRDHGGKVGIESREGVGTVVTLQFPRKDRRVRMLK